MSVRIIEHFPTSSRITSDSTRKGVFHVIKAAAFIVKQVVKIAKNAAVKAANEGAGKPFPTIAVEGVCTITDDAIDALYKAVMVLPEQERREAVQVIAEATPEQLAGTVDAEVDAEVGDASPRVREDVREAATAIAAQLRSNAQSLLTAPDARGVSVFKPGVTLNSREDIRRLLRSFPGSLHTGDLVGNRFSIVRTLAKGGMGVVYLADDQHLGERVALKTIRPELSVSPQVRSRFLEEAKLARRLSHPNIIRVHDAAIDDARKLMFLSMEAVEGESLNDWIRRRPEGCSLEEFRPIAEQVCAAVEYAHRRGVLHLDLKPSNVMVSADLDSVWVLDFGLGQALTAGRADATSLGGTAYSMSPEQIRGDKVDQRADVYSLGALLFHLLTGEIAIGGMGTAADEREGVPRELSDAIAKGMKRRPEDRWASIRDFGNALRAANESDTITRRHSRPAMVVPRRTSATSKTPNARSESDGAAEEWFERGRNADTDYADHDTVDGKSDEQAFACYSRAAELGHAGALHNLGLMYESGRGIAKDETKAADYYRRAADEGNPDAQYSLGVIYEFGRGVPKDEAIAAEWYRRSAEQGDAEAQYYLGCRYAEGRGVRKDDARALRWLLESASQGNAEAQYKLGVMYDEGQGVTQSHTKALEMYHKSADQGHADAQCNLGVMYHYGRGVRENHTKAIEWYQKSADQGHADSQCNLGLMYENGQGVRKDDAKAVEWYRKSAEQGRASGQFNLGDMYEHGTGVDKDLAEAIRLYELAAAQGDEDAAARLKALKPNG
jgi:TPR repeat protein